MPAISAGQLVYSLVRREGGTGGEDAHIKLTIAGMAHLGPLSSMVAMYLRVLGELPLSTSRNGSSMWQSTVLS